MRGRQWILALALALSACGQTPEKAADAAAHVRAPSADTRIGPDGAAGIAAAIPLTVEAVQADAPLFIVAAGEGQVEGDPYPLITLALGDEIVFTLTPNAARTHVNAITTRSAQARGPNNEVIGQTTFAQAPAAEVLFCRTPVTGHEGFSFTCATDEAGRFWRAYSLPQEYQGPRAPFTAISPDAAVAATLVEMRWFAPR